VVPVLGVAVAAPTKIAGVSAIRPKDITFSIQSGLNQDGSGKIRMANSKVWCNTAEAEA